MVYSLGFLGLRVYGLGFWGFRAQDLCFRVEVLGLRV
jgi:hypothetical protein